MKLKKIIILLVSYFCFSSFADTRTDAIILSTKSVISGGIGQTNSVDTGITIENGDLWIWGFRGSGQQGNGKMVVYTYTEPARVESFVEKGLNITQVAAGIYHMIALDDKGNVWGWGQNGYQEAAAGLYKGANPSSPVLILENKNVIQVVAGEYVSFALTKDGDVYTWGHGIYGQVANGDLRSVNTLYRIPRAEFDNRPVVLIGAAYEGGYAINDWGGIYAWGDDQNDSFAYPRAPAEHVYIKKPLLLTNLAVDSSQIRYICGGEAFTNFLTSSGEVYGMGRSNMLGIGSDRGDVKNNTTTPVRIIGDVKSLYCRYGGSVAITQDNKIVTWGFSNNQFDMYGIEPIERTHIGNLLKIDGGKEHLFYWNDEGEGYGVGYGAGRKFSLTSTSNVKWPGIKLQFVIDAMKKVYGQDYIPGIGIGKNNDD